MTIDFSMVLEAIIAIIKGVLVVPGVILFLMVFGKISEEADEVSSVLTKGASTPEPKKEKRLSETMSEPPYSYGAINTYEEVIEDEDLKHCLIAKTLLGD